MIYNKHSSCVSSFRFQVLHFMIYLGADHRGFELKEKIKKYLESARIAFEDMGAFEYNKDDDYPDFAYAVARKVGEKPEENKGILLCGSGHGVDIVANKVKGAYSFLAWSKEAAALHESANIVTLPAEFLSSRDAIEIVDMFLKAAFPLPGREERDTRRMKKIQQIERENFK